MSKADIIEVWHRVRWLVIEGTSDPRQTLKLIDAYFITRCNEVGRERK